MTLPIWNQIFTPNPWIGDDNIQKAIDKASEFQTEAVVLVQNVQIYLLIAYQEHMIDLSKPIVFLFVQIEKSKVLNIQAPLLEQSNRFLSVFFNTTEEPREHYLEQLELAGVDDWAPYNLPW